MMILALTLAVGSVIRGDEPSVSRNGDAHNLKIDVGRSRVIKAPWAVKRVSVANPKIADVQILTPQEVLVVGNEIGVTDLYLWNEEGQMWQAEVEIELNLQRLQKDIKEFFPTAEVLLSKSNDVVVARGIMRRVEDVKN